MPIDINELRRKVNSTDVVDHIDLHANIKPFLSELIDRLEAAEEDRSNFILEMGKLCAQCDALCLRIEAAEKERDELQVKVEAMEKQEPAGYGVRYVEPANGEDDWDSIWMHRAFAEDHIKDFTRAYADMGEPVGAITVVPLYALPGAQTQGEGK